MAGALHKSNKSKKNRKHGRKKRKPSFQRWKARNPLPRKEVTE